MFGERMFSGFWIKNHLLKQLHKHNKYIYAFAIELQLLLMTFVANVWT